MFWIVAMRNNMLNFLGSRRDVCKDISVGCPLTKNISVIIKKSNRFYIKLEPLFFSKEHAIKCGYFFLQSRRSNDQLI